jgi:RNA recognition motif-containing protein
MSIRLYVGNLPKELDRQELAAVFAEEGDSVSTKVITDRKTGKCRGFGFVTVKTPEQADEIIEKYNNCAFKDTTLKIEKALPRSKGKGDEELPSTNPVPTPSPNTSAGTGSSSRRKGNNNKSRRTSTTSTTDTGATQPDPRWAEELEKLKQLLATQTTNP